MKLFLLLIFSISSVTSWGCRSLGCRTVTHRCWRPSCGMSGYLTNRDYFMYWWKPAVKVLRLSPSKWRNELSSVRAEFAEDINAMKREVAEMRADNEALAAETRTDFSNLRSELAGIQADIQNIKEETQAALAGARSDLMNFRNLKRTKDLKWEELNQELRSDVDNLRTMLYNHKRDDLRSVVLWPSGCGSRCEGNYGVAYGIWVKLSHKLERTYSTEWSGYPCGKRRRVMRKSFLRWCQSYPEPVRVRLIGYYDYLVAGNACSW